MTKPLPSDAVAVYRDIKVAPARRFRLQSKLVDGGPLWPDFATQPIVRFLQGDRWVDEPIRLRREPRRSIDRPCLWGGYAIDHFGHLIADQMTRILTGAVQRPDDVVLFVLRPGATPEDAPGFFWEVLEWYGVGRDRVRFVTKPTLVAELRCYAQAEPLGSHGPDAAYLDLLDRNAMLRGLEAKACDVVYVGRPGMLAKGKGGAAGESYLIGLLGRLGVRVLDPAREGLRDQLAAYAGAATLIFAEGSAVHGRQLLGRVDQRVEILNRRRGARMAEAALTPRVTRLTYVEAAGRVIAMGTMTAKVHAAVGLALYDVEEVMAAFARAGVDLAAHWDDDEFAAAVLADAENWLGGVSAEGVASGFDVEAARVQLRDAGVAVDLQGERVGRMG